MRRTLEQRQIGADDEGAPGAAEHDRRDAGIELGIPHRTHNIFRDTRRQDVHRWIVDFEEGNRAESRAANEASMHAESGTKRRVLASLLPTRNKLHARTERPK